MFPNSNDSQQNFHDFNKFGPVNARRGTLTVTGVADSEECVVSPGGTSPEPAAGHYGIDYLDWKAWGNESFGALNKTQASYFRAELDKTQRRFPADSQVLEIGFGNGGFLAFGRRMRWRIQGTELNADLVGAGARAGFDVRHTNHLRSYADATFDLIVAFDVLEHISQENLLEFLSEAMRTLKPDGRFLARFPNGDSPFGLVHQNGDFTHVNSIGSGKVQYLARKLGVDLVFMGSEAQPIWGVAPALWLHRLFAVPIKKIIGVLVKLIFFPAGGPAFCSANLIVIFKPARRAPPAA